MCSERSQVRSPASDCGGPTLAYELESDRETALTAGDPRPPGSAPRSCFSCHSKKIRCDKKQPCTACIRAARPCTYPPAGPRVRRTRKAMAADMAVRVASLERDLAEAKNEKKRVLRQHGSKDANRPASKVSAPRVSIERSREDILVQNGSSIQYFNEILLSKVLEERNLESILRTPPQAGAPVLSPFNVMGILSSPSLCLAPASFHPLQEVATRLWNIYKNKVDSCSGFKLLHIPTDEVKLYSVIHDPASASPENLALCFAIYFTSTISLDDAEALYLGYDKQTLLFRFKIGFEQSLAHGDFLDCPTLTGLTALVVYLSSLRLRNRGKGMWALMGLAIRIAQTLGLHRDGKRLGLSVFETELRRRLWWHLLSKGSRTGEDYGVENTNGLLLDSDVDLPGNFEDADLYPEMLHLPEPRKGWTHMTASLAYIEVAKTMEKLDTIATSAGPCLPSEDTRAKIIKDASVYIERLLENCNPVVPHQHATCLCSRFLLRKLDFITRLQWQLLRHVGPDKDFVTEENMIEALEVLEPRLTDGGVLQQFAWVRKAFPQYHVTMYILWHLCIKPIGPSVDRAWETVDILFSRELGNEPSEGVGSKMTILVALKEKAMAVRARVEGQKGQEKQLVRSRPEQVSPECANLSTSLPDNPAGSEFSLDTVVEEWPNWSTMLQGFQLDNTGISWH